MFVRALFDRAALDNLAEITADTVITQFGRQTGLPELFLRDEIPLKHAEVVETLSREVIGQAGACEAAAGIVTTFKAGLNDPARPLGVLLFCGPTGVGKTELAKALSRYFFGHGDDRNRMVRLDMSEYAGPGAAAKLMRDAQGQPSELIKRVRQQPFTVVLFDEIEKADAEVFDMLLGVFDEGRLTDHLGRTTNFRSAVLIMTSNLGAGKMGAVGFEDAGPPSYEGEAMAFFRPEFFNRIDMIVRFDPLSEESVLAITRKELAALARREGLAAAKVTWAETLVKQIAIAGYDARYGARPLQRTIEQRVVAPLARLLVDRPELKGQTISIDVGDEEDVIDIMVQRT
jgi:ATP-dependent Clp protease ATP-binding subunit ClpC